MGAITVTTNVSGASIMVVSGSKIKAEGTADVIITVDPDTENAAKVKQNNRATTTIVVSDE